MQVHQHVDTGSRNPLGSGGIAQAIDTLKMIKRRLQALAKLASVLGAPAKAKRLDPRFVVRL